MSVNKFLILIAAIFLISGCSLNGNIKTAKNSSPEITPITEPVQGTKEITFTQPTEYINTNNQSHYTVSGTCDLTSKIVVEVNSSVVKNDIECLAGEFSAQLDLSSFTQGSLAFRAYPIEFSATVVPETTVAIVKDINGPTLSGSVSDGVNYVSVVSSPTLSWSAATDAHSGVAKYQIAVGTTSGGVDIRGWSDIGNVTSYQVTGLTLTRGVTYYASLRAVDNAGNVSLVINSDGWEADSNVNAITNLTLLEAETSLVASPEIAFSYSQSGNTLSFSEYEYSIGSTSGANDIKAWTSLGSATSFQATSLTLSVNNTYYVNVRAKDTSGKASSVVTGQWRVVNSVTVAARYASAANWNDYVKKSATTTACQTTDTLYYNCIHGGEKKEVTVTGENSCVGMTAYDTLGVFDWVCQAGTPVKMVSIEVKSGKGLKDLVEATSWKTNRIIVKKSGTPVMASTAAAWWTNTISALPDSTAGQVTLSNASRIYTTSVSQLTRGYYINANKIAIVTLGDAKLTLDPNGAANATSSGATGADYYAMFINGTRLHTWLEGHFVGSYYSNSLIGYFAIGGFQYFNVINNSYIEDFYYGFNYGLYRTLLKSVRAINNRTFQYSGSGANYNVVKNSTFSGEFDSIGSSGANSNYFLANYFAPHSNTFDGLSTFSHTDSNIIANTLDSGLDIQQSTRATVHNTLKPSGYISNSGSSALTISDLLGTAISNIMSATNFKITGLFAYNACGAVAFSGTGITASCGMAGSSDATTVAPIDILHTSGGGQTFVGFVTSDSHHPGYNSASGVPYASITNWVKFDRPSRFWVDSNREYCGSGETCFIYDYALSLNDTLVLNKSGNLSTANAAFPTVETDNCPSQVHGNQTVIDQKTSAQTFLRNAVEITGDMIGDDDGLCESNEACIYTPNIGAYQGHGDFTAHKCTFVQNGGAVSGVTMYGYPQNGY